MTNLQIITDEAIANGLFTKEEVEAIYTAGHELPLHTYAGWKQRGYQVRRGEHARITTKLWQYNTKKQEVKTTDGNDEEIEIKNCYLVKSYLFTLDQVDKIEA